MPHKEKLFVRGNHERGRIKEQLDESYFSGVRECCGLRVCGLPYGSFGSPSSLVNSGLDLLLSHEPPYGTLDLATHSRGGAKRIGSGSLQRALAHLSSVPGE